MLQTLVPPSRVEHTELGAGRLVRSSLLRRYCNQRFSQPPTRTLCMLLSSLALPLTLTLGVFHTVRYLST